MKIVFIFLAVLFSFSAFAQDLNGVWEVTKRECTDGKPTLDRFLPGVDNETYIFDSSRMTFKYRLEYLNGFLTVDGTFHIDTDSNYTYLKSSSLHSLPRTWSGPSSTYGDGEESEIEVTFLSPNEIKIIKGGATPFETSCGTGNPLYGIYRRQ